jgi:hypothetical protein
MKQKTRRRFARFSVLGGAIGVMSLWSINSAQAEDDLSRRKRGEPIYGVDETVIAYDCTSTCPRTSDPSSPVYCCNGPI